MKSQLIFNPSSFDSDTIWLEDSLSPKISVCRKCAVENRCIRCQQKYDAKFVLLENLDRVKLGKALKENELIKIKTINDALYIEGIEKSFEVFTGKRQRYLENKYSTHFFLYEKEKDPRAKQNLAIVTKPGKPKFDRKFHLKLNETLPTTSNGAIENFDLIFKESLLPKEFVCEKTKNCKFSTFHYYNFKRHEAKCGINNVKRIKCVQTTYGDDYNVLREMANDGYIPMEAIDYRNFSLCTYDIETIEIPFQNCAPDRGMVTEANHKLLSIAVGSNMKNMPTKCWVRKTLEPSEETRLVSKFVDYLYQAQKQKMRTLPEWISDALVKIEEKQIEMKRDDAKWWEMAFLSKYKRAMKNLQLLDTFGFNSSKFDIPVLMAPLILELKKRGGRLNILKKNTAYISIQNDTLSFKDALRFSSPCSYDKFIKVWEVEGEKSIWPYSLFNSIEEIKSAKKFPKYTDFRSNLKGGQLPDKSLYIKTAREFHRRRLLPKNHPEKFNSMLGFLKYYNSLDVGPLAQAITNCFECYDKYFGVNPITAVSLPALASIAMYKNFEEDSPLFFTFSEDFKKINELFRMNMNGGLVNVFLRHVSTFDQPERVPKAARYAKNGDPYSCIVSLDFTSMYLFAEMQDMPTSPGILWTKNDKGNYHKKIMTPGHSLKAQKWLEYMQVSGELDI